MSEAVTINGYELAAQNKKFSIRTPQGQTYAYEMQIMKFVIPIYDIVQQGTTYIMKYGRPSLGFTGISYEPAETRLDPNKIAELFRHLGKPQMPLTVNTQDGEKSVTFIKA